jgi:hypothetical protein
MRPSAFHPWSFHPTQNKQARANDFAGRGDRRRSSTPRSRTTACTTTRSSTTRPPSSSSRAPPVWAPYRRSSQAPTHTPHTPTVPARHAPFQPAGRGSADHSSLAGLRNKKCCRAGVAWSATCRVGPTRGCRARSATKTAQGLARLVGQAQASDRGSQFVAKRLQKPAWGAKSSNSGQPCVSNGSMGHRELSK